MIEAKRRSAIFLLLAFVLAATTGYLVLEKVKDLNAELGGMTSIYIANGNIPSRTLINSAQVTKMDIPNKFVTESHVLSEIDLVDKVSIVPLNPGDIVTKNMIKPVSNLQNENNRLVTMYRTDQIQFDQVLAALDRVDMSMTAAAFGSVVPGVGTAAGAVVGLGIAVFLSTNTGRRFSKKVEAGVKWTFEKAKSLGKGLVKKWSWGS